MIFSGDCGRSALIKACRSLAFRLRVGHFWTVAIPPLIGNKVRLVGHPLAIRWLEVGWNLRIPGLQRTRLLPHDQSSNSGRGLFGESGYGMGVDVESNGDGGMAQPIGDHLGMNTGRQSQGGMGMTKIV